jgi:hypothetical protein
MKTAGSSLLEVFILLTLLIPRHVSEMLSSHKKKTGTWRGRRRNGTVEVLFTWEVPNPP